MVETLPSWDLKVRFSPVPLSMGVTESRLLGHSGQKIPFMKKQLKKGWKHHSNGNVFIFRFWTRENHREKFPGTYNSVF